MSPRCGTQYPTVSVCLQDSTTSSEWSPSAAGIDSEDEKLHVPTLSTVPPSPVPGGLLVGGIRAVHGKSIDVDATTSVSPASHDNLAVAELAGDEVQQRRRCSSSLFPGVHCTVTNWLRDLPTRLICGRLLSTRITQSVGFWLSYVPLPNTAGQRSRIFRPCLCPLSGHPEPHYDEFRRQHQPSQQRQLSILACRALSPSGALSDD